MSSDVTIGQTASMAAASPSPLALRRHLDYLLVEARRFPCGEFRHFLGCALLALEDHLAGCAPATPFTAVDGVGHA